MKPTIGMRPGGKYANGTVPPAHTPPPPPPPPPVDYGLTGAAIDGLQRRNQANRAALDLKDGTASVRGPAGIDKVPVNLTRGEAVLPVKTVQAIGVGNIKRMIEATNNGKAPHIGMRSKGKYADGVIHPDEKQALEDRAAIGDFGSRVARSFSMENPLIAAGADLATLPGRAAMGVANTALRLPNAFGAGIPFIPERAFGGNSASMTPYYDKVRAPDAQPAAAQPAVQSPPSIGARTQPSQAVVPAPIATQQPTSNNYIRNESTGKTTYLSPTSNESPAQPFASNAVPQGISSFAPTANTLAGDRKSTGYQPTTLAGALVKYGETKRQSGLEQQDNTNALAAYEADGRDRERVSAASDRTNQADLAGRRLSIEEAKAKKEKYTPILGKDDLGNTIYQGAFDTGTGTMKKADGQGGQIATRQQVDAAAKAKGITDPAKLNELYKTYGVQ